MKNETADMIKERKRGYMDIQRGRILADDANRNFFKHTDPIRHDPPTPPPQIMERTSTPSQLSSAPPDLNMSDLAMGLLATSLEMADT